MSTPRSTFINHIVSVHSILLIFFKVLRCLMRSNVPVIQSHHVFLGLRLQLYSFRCRPINPFYCSLLHHSSQVFKQTTSALLILTFPIKYICFGIILSYLVVCLCAKPPRAHSSFHLVSNTQDYTQNTHHTYYRLELICFDVKHTYWYLSTSILYLIEVIEIFVCLV